MKTLLPLLMFIATLSLTMPVRAADFSAHALAGYKDGLSFRAGIGWSHFAKTFPLGIDLAMAYSLVEPGDPYTARSVFINDATNGTPEKHGTVWDFRLDFLYPLVRKEADISLLIGPRLSFFEAFFKYVGANEAFDITSQQWGFGIGAKGSFPINERLSLVLLAGLDYYFPGPLVGHDTVYYPNDQNVNSRLNYTYRDAVATVNMPALEPVVMIGLSF